MRSTAGAALSSQGARMERARDNGENNVKTGCGNRIHASESQLEIIRRDGGRTRTRTLDPLIKSQLLYQLSYAPVACGDNPLAFRQAPSFSKNGAALSRKQGFRRRRPDW